MSFSRKNEDGQAVKLLTLRGLTWPSSFLRLKLIPHAPSSWRRTGRF